MLHALIVVAAVVIGGFSATGVALAQSATEPPSAPAPAESQPPNAPADPCGSILSVVTRPTVTTSVCTVRAKRVLLENGYTNTVTTGPGGGNTAAYPQTYMRFGSSDPHLEFDVTPPTAEQTSLGGTLVSGSSDVNLGAKYELGYGPKWIYGVNGLIVYPTGSSAFTSGNAQFVGNFNWAYAVNSVVGFAGTLGFNGLSGFNASGTAQSYFAFIPTLEVTASLPGPSEFFGEYAYFSQTGPALGSKNLFDFGYIRDFGSSVQLDVEYGFSPTPLNGQKQHYVGAGASFMF